MELSYFVPLLIGHGGNTGSQSVSTVIRALALGQVSVRDVSFVVAKEGLAGSITGAALGTAIFAISLMWDGMSPGVGLCVAVSLPIVSLWANVLGATLPLAASDFVKGRTLGSKNQAFEDFTRTRLGAGSLRAPRSI